MSEFSFPLKYRQVSPAAGDYIPKNTTVPTAYSLYRASQKTLICPLIETSNVTDTSYMFYDSQSLTNVPYLDTGNVTNMSYMFYYCKALISVPHFDTSNVTNMERMFYYCSKLSSIPHFDTSNITNMQYMFAGCDKLYTVPHFDTSKVTTMQYMFQNCFSLYTIPELDFSSVTNVSGMFAGCSKLYELPNINTVKLANFGGSSSYSWLYNCTQLSKIGVVDCDSITNIAYFFGGSANSVIKKFGGCKNLGKMSSLTNTGGSSFMKYAPNLTYESLMNVINGLYDRAAAGYSVIALALHANHLAKLSEDDIAIATNKGWSISS